MDKKQKRIYWRDRAVEKLGQMIRTGHRPYLKEITDYLYHAELMTPEITKAIDDLDKPVNTLLALIAVIDYKPNEPKK